MDILEIKEFFIFNTKLKSPLKKPSDDDVQDAKLLYYYPENTEILVKRSNMGIIEGTTAFMKEFEKSNSNFLLAELNKVFFIANNYEDDFTICFILRKKSINPTIFNRYENIETKKKWLKLFLDNFYNTFILFHNKLNNFFISKENPEINTPLSSDKYNILHDFILNYIKYMEAIRYPLIDNLQYVPMSTNAQAALILSIQRLQEKIPDIKMCSITYQGKIIFNQLPFNDISLLYNIFFNSYLASPKFFEFSSPPFETLSNVALKQEIKIDEEKLFSQKASPFRKVFNLLGSKSDFLIGIKDMNINSYKVFIPNLYIKELDSEFRLLVYFYYDMLIFLFVDKKFNVIRNIEKVKKVSHWVDKFFKDNLKLLSQSPRMINESHIFCYTNKNNRSIRLCNVIKKNQIDEKFFEIIKRALFNNENNEFNSLTKFKGYYVYYIKSIGRKIVMIFKDNLTMTQLNNEISKVKKDNFFYIFLS